MNIIACQTCQNPIDLNLGKTCLKCQPRPNQFLSRPPDKIPGLTAEMEDVSLAMGINPRDPSQGMLSTNPNGGPISPLNSISAKKGQAFGLSPSMMRKPLPKFDLIPQGDFYDNSSAFVDEPTSPGIQRVNMNSSSAAQGQAFGLSPSLTRMPPKSKPMGLVRDVLQTEAAQTQATSSPVGSLDDVHLAMGHGLPDPLYAINNGREADELGIRRRYNNSPSAPKGKAYGLSPTLLRKARITSFPEMGSRPLVQADCGPPDTQLRFIDPFGRPLTVALGSKPTNPTNEPLKRSPSFRRRSLDDTDDGPQTVDSEELFGGALFATSKERSPIFARHYNANWVRRSLSVGTGLTELSEEDVQYSRTPPQRYSHSRLSLPEPIEPEPVDLSQSAPAAISGEREEEGGLGKAGKKDKARKTHEDRDRLKRWLASKLNRHNNAPT